MPGKPCAPHLQGGRLRGKTSGRAMNRSLLGGAMEPARGECCVRGFEDSAVRDYNGPVHAAFGAMAKEMISTV